MQHHQVSVIFQGMFIVSLNKTEQRFEARPLKADGHSFSVFASQKMASGAIAPLGTLVDITDDITISSSENSTPTIYSHPSDPESSDPLIKIDSLNKVAGVNADYLGPLIAITSGTMYTASMLPGNYIVKDTNPKKSPGSSMPRPVGATIGIDISTATIDQGEALGVTIYQNGQDPIFLKTDLGAQFQYQIIASNVRSQQPSPSSASDFPMYYSGLQIDRSDPHRYDLVPSSPLDQGFPVICNGILVDGGVNG